VASSRIVSKSAIVRIANQARKSKKRIVFTNGVFDILHRGHVQYLTKAKAFGDLLIVGMNTDASVKRLKGPSRPLQPEKDRAYILSSLRCVDYIVLFGEDTPDKIIRAIKPDVLVKGADYKIADIVGADFVSSYGGKVKRVKIVTGRSSSKIIAKLK
jgi:D-beta-D-heptose 7-phosphate kinase/D-beta-D-heptose 1-phosphate adenosyltransferase